MVKVLGIEKYEFPNSQTGEVVKVHNLHCVDMTKIMNDVQFVGQRCAPVSVVNVPNLGDIEIGKCYELVYGMQLGRKHPSLTEVRLVAEQDKK